MFFSDIIGQAEIKDRLIHSINSNRISHAQLFFEQEGAGGLALALAYAQYIHCTNRKPVDSCGECPSCQKHAKLVHPDLHFVFPIALSKENRVSTAFITEWREALLEDAYLTLQNWFDRMEAENKQPVIAVDESAEILKKLSLTTFEGEYKIMIIWHAEKMNIQAANKLLKILEEPPDKTLFLLVTNEEDQLLRTIVSRTQLIKIRAIADADMKDVLMKKHSLSSADADKIAFQANGSYPAAKLILERSEQAVFNLETFRNWMRACLKFDMQKVLSVITSLEAVKRERQKQFISYGLDLIRECLVFSYGNKQMVRLAGEELEFVTKFSTFIHAANGSRFIEAMDKAAMHIERNGNAKMIFMDLSFTMNELLNVPKPKAAEAE